VTFGFSNPTDIGGFIEARPTVENKINLYKSSNEVKKLLFTLNAWAKPKDNTGCLSLLPPYEPWQ
jgi:hypothetical protein